MSSTPKKHRKVKPTPKIGKSVFYFSRACVIYIYMYIIIAYITQCFSNVYSLCILTFIQTLVTYILREGENIYSHPG